jgi:hypothetical protein
LSPAGHTIARPEETPLRGGCLLVASGGVRLSAIRLVPGGAHHASPGEGSDSRRLD